jgi:signal transduction histidine kinase
VLSDIAQAARPEPIPVNPLRALGSPYLWLATVHLASDLIVPGVLAGLGWLVGAWVGSLFGRSLGGGAGGLALRLLGPAMLTVWLFLPLSTFERARYRLTLGMSIAAPRLPPRGHSWGRWALALTASDAVWRQLAYYLLLVPLSLVNLGGLLLAWSVPPALVLLPVYYPEFSARHTAIAGFSVGTRSTGWVVSGLAALFLVLVSPQVIRGLSRADAALARSLLGPSVAGQLTERVGELETSRRRAVDSAEAERRRIERDLHDGAQQRLVSLALTLGRVKARLPTQLDPDTRLLIDDAYREARLATAELRDLTRGLHPPVLTDRGLDAALSAVAARAPVPVQIDVRAEPRPSPTVEAIAYFVVTEALTNVAKHARATRAWVEIRCHGGLLRITVADDGVGGAEPAAGSGLSGLADRLSGVDGRLSVVSPRGGPTALTVEIPCGS